MNFTLLSFRFYVAVDGTSSNLKRYFSERVRLINRPQRLYLAAIQVTQKGVAGPTDKVRAWRHGFPGRHAAASHKNLAA